MERFNNYNFSLEEIEVNEKEMSATVVFNVKQTELFYLPEHFEGYFNMFVGFRLYNGKAKFFAEYSHSDFNNFIEKLLNNRYIDNEEIYMFAAKFMKSDEFKCYKNTKVCKALQSWQVEQYLKRDSKEAMLKCWNKPKIINIFGGPGAGKSTLALQIAAELKKQGYNADYVSEVAKDFVYEGNVDLLKDESTSSQIMLFRKQKRKLDLCVKGGVEYIVVDSPLLLNLAYYKGHNSSDIVKHKYIKYVTDTFNKYRNVNILVHRSSKNYQNFGRIQNYTEALLKDNVVYDLLKRSNATSIDVSNDTEIKKIIDYIISIKD